MLVKEYTKEIEVNGKPLASVIQVHVEEEYYLPKAGEDFDLGTDKDNQAYERRFAPNTGDLFNAVIQVTASAHGLTGVDTLGSCHISCNSSNSTPFEQDIEDTIKEHTMVRNAIESLVELIKLQANELSRYVTKEL